MITRAERIERKEARIARKAAKIFSAANAAYSKAATMAESIPFGQPIQPAGHHSRQKDINFRRRIENTFIKSARLQVLAEKMSNRTASDAILSSDADALELLQAKLEKLKNDHEKMKTANKLIKQGCNADDLMRIGFSEKTAEALINPAWHYAKGFQKFELSNNLAKIKHTQDRITLLERNKKIQQQEVIVGCCKAVSNTTDLRLQLFFDGKPSAAVIAELKKNGFKWAPSNQAWQRLLNANAIRAFHQLKNSGIFNQ